EYLDKIIAEGVEIRKFPDDVLVKLKDLSDEVIAEQCAANAELNEVYQSMNTFKNESNAWRALSEDAMAPYLK
ncbi:MAG: ABC transporter substrate-binding protein, partial [Bacteroidia bacterium]|nr:ABC transporter substrate-binding protein [Bacteroidia bacterium]